MEPRKNFLDISKFSALIVEAQEGIVLFIHSFGLTDLDVSEGTRANASDRLKATEAGEIERVAWLRATDRPRRIDRSLLTENHETNWSWRDQAAERERQAHLLSRKEKAGAPKGNRPVWSSGRKL